MPICGFCEKFYPTPKSTDNGLCSKCSLKSSVFRWDFIEFLKNISEEGLLV